METDLQELLSALNLDLVDPELDLEYLRSGRKQYHEYRAADIDRLETQASLASAARTFRGAFPTEQIEKGLTRLPKTIASTGALHKLGYMFGPRTSIKDMIAFFMLEFRDSIVVCRALGKSEVDEIVGLSAHMELQQGRAATSSSNGSVHRDRTVAVLHLEDFENANTGFINWWRDLSHASSDAADFRRRGMAEGAFERDFLAELCLDDFRSAMSVISNTTFHTAMKGRDTEGTEATSKGLQKDSEYAQLLAKRNLWPVEQQLELDWSGRGQHAEFLKDERRLLNDILEVHDTLGSTRSAIVQSVRCRRILLARKSITCGRSRQSITKEEAVEEVLHLTRLNHAHIVRIIGTYTIGRELSILLYPVADYNLERFLEVMGTDTGDRDLQLGMISSCVRFFSCLANALHYIHGAITKHMDIKPQNILVRRTCGGHVGSWMQPNFKVYLADFGISRTYQELEATETDGPISFTRKYAAPEVVHQEVRGLSADIFSLGCVYLEMSATLSIMSPEMIDYVTSLQMEGPTAETDFSPTSLQKKLHSDCGVETSYQANADCIREALAPGAAWVMARVPKVRSNTLQELIREMMRRHPKCRPSAQDLVNVFGPAYACCIAGAEAFEAM